MRLVITSWQRLPRRLFSTGQLLAKHEPRRVAYYPQFNPLDDFKKHIVDRVSKDLGIESTTVYNAIQYTRTLDYGDLKLVIPALKLKDNDHQAVATRLAELVCSFLIPRESSLTLTVRELVTCIQNCSRENSSSALLQALGPA